MASTRKSRRRSVVDANSDLLGHVHNTIERLTTLWDQVSMDQSVREKRTESAYNLFYATMNEIVQNEEEMVKGVFADIQRDLVEVDSTRTELGMNLFPTDKYTPNSMALLKALDKDKKNLKERKAQAMAHQLEEFNELVKICHCISEPVPEYNSVEDKIMPKSQVEEIVKQRVNFSKELSLRKTKLHELQNKVNRRFNVIKNVALADKERELLVLNLADPNMIFSRELVKRFNDLMEKFEVEYEKWRENIVRQYSEAHAELSSLSEKCYAQNLLATYPDSIDLDIHDESLLQKIQFDVQLLRARYESGKDLFDKFSRWHSAFKKQEIIEDELNTDRVRKNRGGCLNVVLGQQKKNNALFDQCLRELQAGCEATDVTIDGFTPYNFATNLILDREQQKENEKEAKKLNKTKQLQMEAKFGNSGKSPSMKSVVGINQESRVAPKSPFTKSPRSQYPKSPHKHF